VKVESKPDLPGQSTGVPLILPLAFVLLVAVFNIDRAVGVFGSTLPGEVTGTGWFAAALEDVVIAAVASLLGVLVYFGSKRSRTAATVYALLAVAILSVIGAANALYVEYFHHVVTRPDIILALDPSLVRGAAAGVSGNTFLALSLAPVVVFLLLLLFVRSRVVSARWLGGIGVLCIVAVGARLLVGRRSVQAGLSDVVWNGVELLSRPKLPEPKDLTPLRALVADPTVSFASRVDPLWHSPSSMSAEPLLRGALVADGPPNVVFIFLEGMRGHETGVGGAPFPHLTPNLDRLAHEGVYFSNFYASGTHTYQAEIAALFSTFPYPGAGGILPDRVPVRLFGIPEVLRRAGYPAEVWIHGNDRTEFHRDWFYPRHGVEIYDARFFPKDAPRSTWGFDDRVVLSRAVDVLSEKKEPFLGLIITISNHYPFPVPADSVDTYPRPVLAPSKSPFDPARTVPWGFYPHFIQTVHYADEALGMFIERASSRPWFRHTLFVIFGDHGIPLRSDKPYLSEDDFLETRDRIPLILYCPAWGRGERVDGLGSQVDIAPTVLGLLGVRSPSAFVGRDLLAGPEPASRFVLNWGDGYTLRLIARKWEYRASVSDDLADIFEERLFDRAADPRRVHDLARQKPAIVEGFRDLARRYLRDYPALIRQDRVVPMSAGGN
jgi:phosphoglycerol transferase MdoB-like AlkP superfamily enzyme